MQSTRNAEERSGKVIWITGLAGSGKTTIGRRVFWKLRETYPKTIFLDGDELRESVAEELGFSDSDRIICGRRYARLCKLLASQGCDVICCTISMYHEIRDWNRANLKEYFEVYIKVPNSILVQRNKKNLYLDHTQQNVVGKDLSFQEPKNPHLTVNNDGKDNLQTLVNLIIDALDQRKKDSLK